MQCSIYLSKIPTTIGLAALVALSVGCGGDEEADSEAVSETASSPQMIERRAPAERSQPKPESSSAEDFNVVPEVASQNEQDGMGLETIINASDKRAYAESMRWIAEDVSEQQLKQLKQSIRFVHMYDSSVFGSDQRLLEYLDGKTGREVIEYAKDLRKERMGQ